MPEIKLCQHCGKPLIGLSPRCQYHPECAKIVHKKNMQSYQKNEAFREKSRERNRINQAKRRAKIKAANQIYKGKSHKTKPCQSSPLSLGQVCKLMKQYGYGNDYSRFVADYHGKIKGV